MSRVVARLILLFWLFAWIEAAVPALEPKQTLFGVCGYGNGDPVDFVIAEVDAGSFSGEYLPAGSSRASGSVSEKFTAFMVDEETWRIQVEIGEAVQTIPNLRQVQTVHGPALAGSVRADSTYFLMERPLHRLPAIT